MFRKLVSNLSFSPALIAEVSFYAKRLRKEELTRRLTVVFVILALVIQSLAIFSPPESANASSEQDLIRGGVLDVNDLLARYDNNNNDIRDIYATLGITRDEIAALEPTDIPASDDLYLMSRYGQFSTEQGEVSLPYKRSAGGSGIRYISPLSLSTSNTLSSFEGWVGQSSQLGWFAIIRSSAAVATKQLPQSVTPGAAQQNVVKKTISAINSTQGSVDASSAAAKPYDKISITLSAQNTTSVDKKVDFSIKLSDAFEYATLIDGGGGTFDTQTKTLSWPPATLSKDQTQTRTFVMQLLSQVPATATGTGNPGSYDCRIAASYGSGVTIPIDCPAVKVIESTTGLLPRIGIAANVTFSLILLATVLFFYARTRQMKKEIRLIRHNLNTGII